MGASETIEQIVALRRVREFVRDSDAQRRLAWVARQLRRRVGPGVPKLQAASVLGVSVQSLDRYIARGKIPTLRRPGSSRELIDSAALLDLAEEVARQRQIGERSPLARAIATLAEQGRLRRRLRPNQPAAELRRELLQTTPAARLRQGIELSELGASLGAASMDGEANGKITGRFSDLLRALVEAGVEFVLIGGLAVGLHGYERRRRHRPG